MNTGLDGVMERKILRSREIHEDCRPNSATPELLQLLNSSFLLPRLLQRPWAPPDTGRRQIPKYIFAGLCRLAAAGQRPGLFQYARRSGRHSAAPARVSAPPKSRFSA